MDNTERAGSPEEIYEKINQLAGMGVVGHSLCYIGKNSIRDAYGISVHYHCPVCQKTELEIVEGLTPADALANTIQFLKEIDDEFN